MVDISKDIPFQSKKKAADLSELTNKVNSANAQLTDIVTVNIRQLGAKKNIEEGGSTFDNIDVINNAINMVSNNFGKGTVWIPEGEYIIAPTTTKRIILKSNVTIEGVGTLKVKNNAGDYETIFGATTNGTYVENVHFRGFRVDQNPSTNTSCLIKIGTANTSQFVMSFQNFKNITVDNVIFDTCSGVNTVLLSGKNCRIASVKNCYFSFAKPINHANYDNSAIYFNCEHHHATGNKFFAPISEKAGGAIETHNGLSVITDNTSEGYGTICNVVSSSVSEPITRDNSDIVVSNNVATKCAYGIRLWSITGMKLSNVIISNNALSVNNADRGMSLVSGISMFRGSGLEGDYENIIISDNNIYFQKDTVQRSDIAEASMFGIGLATRGNLKNISVRGNIINNSPVRGIKLGIEDLTKTITNVQITSNVIVNAGIYQFAGQYYRSSIHIEGTLRQITVENNIIYDDNDVFGGFISIDANVGTYNNVSIKNNKISSKQGGYLYYVNKTKGIDEGDVVKTHYSTVFPPTSKLQLKVGDIVINTGALTPGTSYTGYRVTGLGTTSTLTAGITGSCTDTSNIVTVNDSSNLQVGDAILIAGSGKAPTITQITGNKLLMSSTYNTTVTDGAITYFAPVLKGYGQLQA